MIFCLDFNAVSRLEILSDTIEANTTARRVLIDHHLSPDEGFDLRPGDGVTHKVFGGGMVISVTSMGGDALIEVAFEQVGTKKLMLKTAGVHMTKK